MKFHKVILLLSLTALIIIFDGAESQFPPPIISTLLPPPPPPPPPPPKTPKSTPTSTTPTLPPPPITTPTSTTPTNPSLPPPPPPSTLLSSLPPSSPSIPLSPSFTPPLTSSNPIPPPTPSKPPTPSSPANPGTQFDCSVLLPCSDSKSYCDIPAGKCRVKKNLGDRCNSDDNECLAPLVCRENTCGYSDVETANVRNKNGNDNYNVKKVAIFGAIIVGASGICGLVFFVIRYLKKKRDYDIASRLYSTDDDMSEGDPYPFAERSNSFSKNTPQPPRAPTTNRYDNLPPTGNRAFAPRPGYQNYYNKYNEGMYMRQNMPNEETRTMNLLQQTRGNVMVTPQQNYNWNMRMNQGGLFPIPSVNVVPSPNNMNNVVHPQPNIKNVHSPNNMNNVVSSPKNVNNVASSSNNMNNTRNINNINSPGEDDDSKNDHVAKTLRYSVDYTNDQNNHQTNKPKVVRRDSNTLSSDDIKEAYNMDSKKETQSTYNPSILDTYARESIFAKTLETKLSQSSMKFNNNADDSNAPTIQHNISRTQPFNAYDPVSTVVAE